jgi:hypothetical protein
VPSAEANRVVRFRSVASVALELLPPLPSLGSQGGGEKKEDPLIADMMFVRVPMGGKCVIPGNTAST